MQGAVVVGRTNDRDFWTFSGPSDANGHYTSYFHASDESDQDPVTINIGVALGSTSYGGNLGTAVKFKRNQSATMNIQLGTGTRYTISPPDSYVGAIYEGPVVGVAAAGHVVKPTAAQLARREGQLRDGASRLGSREDDQLLAEPPPRAVALRRVRRKRDRSPLVAGSARSGHAEPAGHAGRAAQLRIQAAKGYL